MNPDGFEPGPKTGELGDNVSKRGRRTPTRFEVIWIRTFRDATRNLAVMNE